METFREAYDVLQRHAQALRNQDEPNIDDLLTIVTESLNAYKVCKQRIDAVEEALKTALDGAGVDPASEPAPPPAARTRTSARPPAVTSAAPRSTSTSGFDDMDDDVPF